MLSNVETLLAVTVLTVLIASVALQWLLNGIALNIPQARQTFWHKAWTGVSWLLMSVALVTIAFSILGPLALILLMVLCVILADCVISFGRAEYRSLYSMLHGILKHRLPLATALRQYASERRDRLGRRAAIVAARVESGEPPETVLQLLVPRRDVDTTLALRFVPETKDLASALQPRSAEQEELDRSLKRVRNLLLYLSFLAMTAGLLLLYATNQVEPVLREVKSQLLEQTSRFPPTISGASPLDQVKYLPAVLALLSVLLFLGWLLHVMGGFLKDVPLLNRWDRLLDRARVLETLARAVERQRPLRESLRFLAEIYPKTNLRSRLQMAVKMVGQGHHGWDALHAARLINRNECRLLLSAEKSGHLPWVLKEVAEQNRRRHVRRLKLVVQYLVILILLIIGLATSAVVTNVFGSLVDLIRGLSTSTIAY